MARAIQDQEAATHAHVRSRKGETRGIKGVLRYWWFWLIVVILVLLVVAHALLPFWVRDYANRKLSEIPGYRGHVTDVTLHLWRGAYQLHGVKIEKTTAKVPAPFFDGPLIDLSVQWKAIWEGAFVGEIDFHNPKLNLVMGPTKEASQTDVDKPWAQKIKQLFPLKINRFATHNGEIHYRDYSKATKIDIAIDRVQMVGTNLTNSKKLSKSLIAEIVGDGRPLREGDARAQASLDPYAPKPTFALNLEMKDIPLVKLNDFAKAYGGFTFESGTLRVAAEMESKNGAFHGYVEPVFDHMGIFNPKHDSDNPVSFVWQAILGGLTQIVRNHPKDRFGTKIPFSGTFDSPQPEVLTTVFNAFRNAFIKAFEGKLENDKVELPKVDPDKKE
jgi:hypothetical protein